MRALAGLAALALLPAVAALPAAAPLVAGPGFGVVTGSGGTCHGLLDAHLSFLPDGHAMAGVDWYSLDAGCPVPLQSLGTHALGTVHYDLAGPAVSFEFPCSGTFGQELACGNLWFDAYQGPGTWTRVRAVFSQATLEGWFLA